MSFFAPPHSSNEEGFQVAIAAQTYVAVLIDRVDFIRKAPITPASPVRIEKTILGSYTLAPTALDGEYDNRDDYPIQP
ncbi:MAG TPA: hypothetical protein VN936_10340 [Candidatus Acidoferrum sp.]|nr:hypothetical protein [Candidatus Acidoferrum sp.]